MTAPRLNLFSRSVASSIVGASLVLGWLAGPGCGNATVTAVPGGSTVAGGSAGSGSGGDGGGAPWTPPDSGFTFVPPPITDAGSGDSLAAVSAEDCGKLKVIVRDFRTDHPDFEKDELSNGLYPGLVKPVLGPDGLPEYAPKGSTIVTSGKAGFDQWYRDVPGVNLRFEITLTLTRSPTGTFVYDNPKFFPIDGMGWPNDDVFGHNFGFTTEIHASFKYKGGEKFTFTGDDDVFVFVNKKLAVDLGGVHVPESGTIDFDADATKLGITVGQTYPFDVFQAERHSTGSTFRMETTIECLRMIIM